MTPEQQRKMLEAAAKACRIEISTWSNCQAGGFVKGGSGVFWNPLTNPADTAEMSAKLDISTLIYKLSATVECFTDNNGSLAHSVIEHDGTPEGKEAAWRLAATMVAAKIGGYEDE